MSLLSKIAGAAVKIGGGFLVGGPAGAVTAAVAGLAKPLLKPMTKATASTISKATVLAGGGGGGKIPNLPALPGGAPMSKLPAIAAAGAGMAGSIIWDKVTGQPVYKRRRRKGISARDLSSFKRVARLIDKFAAPVHHLRKSSFKPHA